ncbi:MAG TPA: hypothetical protein VJR58_08550 [Vineibacter sp.]|nr:hypothetical protein [Vineibacter sp.]
MRDCSRGLQGQVCVRGNASAVIEVLPGLLDVFLTTHPAIGIGSLFLGDLGCRPELAKWGAISRDRKITSE